MSKHLENETLLLIKKERKRSFKIHLTVKSILLMDVSFNYCKASFTGNKVTQVLKVTLFQILLSLYVRIRIKAIPKTFLREAVDFLLKNTVNPLINARDVCNVFGI